MHEQNLYLHTSSLSNIIFSARLNLTPNIRIRFAFVTIIISSSNMPRKCVSICQVIRARLYDITGKMFPNQPSAMKQPTEGNSIYHTNIPSCLAVFTQLAFQPFLPPAFLVSRYIFLWIFINLLRCSTTFGL